MLLIILLGALFKTLSLRSGGRIVAESLGATHLVNTGGVVEVQRLQNVVEEMAIASGMAVPPIYVVPDKSINAFAAGWTTDDAVVGVTVGCMSKLSRDELQGVVAHEFSHITNGDMRLNMRMIGVVGGITLLGTIGSVTSSDVSPKMMRAGNTHAFLGGVLLFVAGLFLEGVGAIGTFFGRMMQAAISRQREFLADAAAVDFTRNPSGISGALRSIAQRGAGNKIRNVYARNIGHLFFTSAFRSVFATHPPISHRIARIEQLPIEQIGVIDHGISRENKAGIPYGAVGLVGASAAVDSVHQYGKATQESIVHANELIQQLPEQIRSALHTPAGAQAAVLATVMASDDGVRWKQSRLIDAQIGSEMLEDVELVRPSIAGLERHLRILILDLAVPSISRIDRGDAIVLANVIRGCVHADKKVDRFEWLLGRIVMRRLQARIEFRSPRRGKRSISDLASSVAVVLLAVARTGSRTEEEAAAAFAQGARSIRAECKDLAMPTRVVLSDLDSAFDDLEMAKPEAKVAVLEAALATATHDGKIRMGEYEMIRAVADALGLGMPPIVPETQRVTTS